MTGDPVKILEEALAAHRLGDETAAAAGYRAVLALQADNADALHLLGTIMARSAPEEGIALIQRALAVNPDSFEAHLNLANTFAKRLRMTDAELHFRAAHKLNPTSIAAINGLGGALLHLGRYAQAEPFLREGLSRDTTSAPALLNMAMLMDATDRVDQGLQFYDRLFAVYPDHAEGHYHQSLALLLRGQFAQGWAKLGWRVKCVPTLHGQFKLPYWRGETLVGRKILVWTELGPGDEILVSTMIPDLLAAGARVVLVCSPRMAPLFARTFPSVDVIAAGQTPRDQTILDGIELQASVAELGTVLRPSFSAFPGATVLRAQADRTADLRRRYKAVAGENLLVGLSWRSKNSLLEDAKSVPLREWAPILMCPCVTFVSLQYGDVALEVAEVKRELGIDVLVDVEINPLNSLDDFAAQVAAMDRVVSVSNTTAHMAGALGRPVSVLIPSNHGRIWYWFLERNDSPWYPGARLFRQHPVRGWQPAIAAVADDVARDSSDARGRLRLQSPAF